MISEFKVIVKTFKQSKKKECFIFSYNFIMDFIKEYYSYY